MTLVVIGLRMMRSFDSIHRLTGSVFKDTLLSLKILKSNQMRQIKRKIAEAFHNRQALKIDNTRTDGTSLWLFNNKIAQWGPDGLYITTAEWNTKTTRERLNGLLGVGVYSSRGGLLLNGHPWDGRWINVNYHNELHEGVPFVDSPPMIVEAQAQDEFDVTSEWLSVGYSRPLYAVFETLDERKIDNVERMLNDEGIRVKRMQSDTAGQYKVNYFLVAKPDERAKAISIIQNL